MVCPFADVAQLVTKPLSTIFFVKRVVAMAPDLGEWVVVPFLSVIPGDSWVVSMPSTVPASLAREPENPGRVEDPYRPPLPITESRLRPGAGMEDTGQASRWLTLERPGWQTWLSTGFYQP